MWGLYPGLPFGSLGHTTVKTSPPSFYRRGTVAHTGMKPLVQGYIASLRGSGLEPWSLCASSPRTSAEENMCRFLFSQTKIPTGVCIKLPDKCGTGRWRGMVPTLRCETEAQGGPSHLLRSSRDEAESHEINRHSLQGHTPTGVKALPSRHLV